MTEGNVLAVGKPRLGSLIDGNPSTPLVTVQLQDTGQDLEVTIPLGSLQDPGPYGSWFQGFQTQKNPATSAKIPPVLLFVDVDGPVALAGCSFSSQRHSFSMGQGRIRVDYAILGARHLNYEKINGIRVSMPALSSWTQLRSLHLERRVDAVGRTQTVNVRLDSPDRIQLARRVNLSLRPTWSTSMNPDGGTFTANDVVELMTATKKNRQWTDHLDPVFAVRELMMLSAWRHFGFSSVSVNRGDDPETVLSGDAVGEKWAPVASHRFPKHFETDKQPRFIFLHSDIGPSGVRNWLRLRQKFARSIRPLVSLLDQGHSYAETELLQSGLAIEALGHQLLIDQGKIESGKRHQSNYWEYASAILDDMTFVPLEDPVAWKTLSKDTYRGVKHADNEKPDILDMLNAHRENVLIMRFWLAGRLGVPVATLQSRLPLDPLATSYTQG